MVVSPIARISRSKSKAELYRQLGLTEGEESHDRLYKLMMEEANAGRDRICRDAQNLVPAKRGTAPPYSASDVTELAMRREVQQIYTVSSLQTRQWYDRAICQDGVNWDNWIIRWCLWHAFRYRDSRNTNSDSPDGRRTRGGSSEMGNSQRSISNSPQEERVVYYRVDGTHGGVYWDPVRDP